MRFFSDAFKYMLRNIHVFLPAAVIPAVLIVPAGNLFSPFVFLLDYGGTEISGVSDMFESVFHFHAWYWIILAMAVNILGVSLLVGIMERHLKSGRYGLRSPFRRINDSIVAVAPLLAVFYAILVALYYAFGGMISLAHHLFSGFGNVPSALNIFIAVVLVLALYIIAFGFISFTIFFIPSHLIMGYPLVDSYSFAIRLHSGNGARFFKVWLLNALIICAFSALCWFAKIPEFVFSAVVTAYIIIFYCSLSMTAFFSVTDTERLDKTGRIGIGKGNE